MIICFLSIEHREHISDVTVRYHKIEAMKYNEKISIPPTKSKAKQFRLMDNMSENQMCGVQQDAIEHHIHTFEHTSNRMDDMLSSLFS